MFRSKLSEKIDVASHVWPRCSMCEKNFRTKYCEGEGMEKVIWIEKQETTLSSPAFTLFVTEKY